VSALAGRSALISGGSRGIGEAIGMALARAGCNVTLLAKTDTPHPTLPGTIHTAVERIEAVATGGAGALAVVGDVRGADDVDRAVAQAADWFGGIDIVVNNASAIALAPIRDLTAARFALLTDVNLRGTFLLTRACLPFLRESEHAHVLTLSPPLTTRTEWLAGFAPYTVTKLGMTMLTLGLAADEAAHGIGANCLWPRTLIATAAVRNLLGGEEQLLRSRTPEIVGDAAALLLARDPREQTGEALIDDEVLARAGITDLDRYRVAPGSELALDLFI
jgi:NAD(P)-dependent dehydrogenase (short-subunit alcohol dehydrogenase family)